MSVDDVATFGMVNVSMCSTSKCRFFPWKLGWIVVIVGSSLPVTNWFLFGWSITTQCLRTKRCHVSMGKWFHTHAHVQRTHTRAHTLCGRLTYTERVSHSMISNIEIRPTAKSSAMKTEFTPGWSGLSLHLINISGLLRSAIKPILFNDIFLSR